MLVEVDACCRAETYRNTGEAGLDGGQPFVGETLLDRRGHLLATKAEQATCDAERDHVGAPFGNGLGYFLHRHFYDAGAGLGHHRRRLAAAGIADHKGLRSDLDFGAEAVGVQPVDANQEVELVGQTLDRMDGQAEQRRRFTAADLRAQGAGREPIPSGGAGRFEQGIPCGQSAGATAADDCDRDAR